MINRRREIDGLLVCARSGRERKRDKDEEESTYWYSKGRDEENAGEPARVQRGQKASTKKKAKDTQTSTWKESSKHKKKKDTFAC